MGNFCLRQIGFFSSTPDTPCIGTDSNTALLCHNICFSRALEGCGKRKNADDVIHQISKYSSFYSVSGGGITLSGGEPLMQFDFCLELLCKVKLSCICTAIETGKHILPQNF